MSNGSVRDCRTGIKLILNLGARASYMADRLSATYLIQSPPSFVVGVFHDSLLVACFGVIQRSRSLHTSRIGIQHYFTKRLILNSFVYLRVRVEGAILSSCR
jgi:hypothetical protein